MTRNSIAQLFQAGIDLFNAGRFFECHEVWEQAWIRAAGDEKVFYQGMIQAAAAILHAQRGNAAGARLLWTKASARLNPLPAEHMGIALDELRRSLERFLAAVINNESRPDPLPTIRRLSG